MLRLSAWAQAMVAIRGRSRMAEDALAALVMIPPKAVRHAKGASR